MKRFRLLLAVAASVMLLATVTVPMLGSAADHLDAPALNPGRLEADVNDLYMFTGSDDETTVLAMTVSPAAGAIGPASFGTDVLYQFNIVDLPKVMTTADTAYRATFGPVDADGNQSFTLYRATGADADGHTVTGTEVASGTTNSTVDVDGGGTFYAGLRSDPFFFDLAGFQGTVGGVDNGRGLGDGMASDFFEPLNVLALVLELPDSALPDQSASGERIGLWASTAIEDSGSYDQADRMGRPAINTVVGSTGPIVMAPAGTQGTFNTAHPKDDVAAFTGAVKSAIGNLSALDSEGSYSDAQLDALAGLLLPDILTFSKNDSSLPPPLNGRDLPDDVIDTELRIVTGGDPLGLFGDRDADGAVNSDGVGPHTDYLDTFPYLGVPNGTDVGPIDSVGVVDQDTGIWYVVEAMRADLLGSSEVPAGSGDAIASGTAVVGINSNNGEVCFELTLSNFQGTVAAAHIHDGAAGVNGPVVVDLDVPTNGTEGCVSATLTLAQDIQENPAEYYVNVHSNLFPAGAARGQLSGGPLSPFYYGNPADVPIFGDWDGDGTATPGLYRQSDGKVYLRNSNTDGVADVEFFFGNPGDVPVAGDWDGDGDDTVSIYRPVEQRFYIINELGSENLGLGAADFSFVFGNPGDLPFTGDFDGDGVDEIALHRISTGLVYARNTLDAGVADLEFIWGDPNDSVFAGDWDGDGTGTPGLFRTSTRTVYLRNSNTAGIADMEIFADGFESGDTSVWTSSR